LKLTRSWDLVLIGDNYEPGLPLLKANLLVVPADGENAGRHVAKSLESTSGKVEPVLGKGKKRVSWVRAEEASA